MAIVSRDHCVRTQDPSVGHFYARSQDPSEWDTFLLFSGCSRTVRQKWCSRKIFFDVLVLSMKKNVEWQLFRKIEEHVPSRGISNGRIGVHPFSITTAKSLVEQCFR